MRSSKLAISLLTAAAVLLPSSASANVLHGNVLTPDGFCTVHQDGTKGVRFTGESYSAFLAEYAADKIAIRALVDQAKIDAEKNGGAPMTELQIGQLTARIKKVAAELQRMRIDQGQAALCR